MSSFKRRATTTPTSNIQRDPHTRPNGFTSSVRETSTGVPSFDDILGGGQPLGSLITVLASDPHSIWGDLLQRYWIAQGLLCGQKVVTVGEEEKMKALVDGCMGLAPGEMERLAGEASGDERDDAAGDENVKIAWRYKGMKRFETTVAHPSSALGSEYVYAFDLTQKIQPEIIAAATESAQLTTLDVEDGAGGLDELVARVLKILDAHKQSNSEESGSSPVLRISIPNLGSPSFGDVSASELLRCLYRLRHAAQSTSVIIFVTLPSYLSGASPNFSTGDRTDGWIQKVGFLSDGCIAFTSFGADQSLVSAFPTYNGFVHVHRAPSIYSLVPPSDKLSALRGLSSPTSQIGGGGENNLGFRCTRKRFVIETLHLGVEGGVGDRRTTPAPTTTYSEPHDTPSIRAPGPAALDIVGPEPTISSSDPPGGVSPKKPKKSVAFKAGANDPYDF